MSIELKPREWLLALWANGTFTVEAADASCWQAIAPPSGIRVVAALPVEAEIKRLHEGREEAEAAWNTQYDELTRLRAALAAAEAKLADEKASRIGWAESSERWRNHYYETLALLADERRHADALKEGLAACVGERATFYAGQTQTVTWAVAIEHAERLLSDHRARRAAEVDRG